MSMRSSPARPSTVRRSRPCPPGSMRPRASDLAGQDRGAHPAPVGHRLAERRAERLGRREDALHVHVEPAVDGLLDQVAADDEEEERGSHRHQQEDEHQAQPEARAQDAPSSLEEHAHEVPAEDEEKAQEEREVENGEAVEQDRREEVGREVAALAEQDLDDQEQPQDGADRGQDEARVVPKRESGGHGASHCSVAAIPRPSRVDQDSDGVVRDLVHWSTTRCGGGSCR